MLISTWLIRLWLDVLHTWWILAPLLAGAFALVLLAAKGAVATADEAAAWWQSHRSRRIHRRDDWPASFDDAHALGPRILERYVDAEFEALVSYLDDPAGAADDAEDGQPR